MLCRDVVVTCEELQRAWKAQIQKVYWATHPWTHVSGPAGAMLLSLKALKWTSSSAIVWKTDIGGILDLRTSAPSTVREL
eukprot:3811522-Pyramimonas_sp.AAC.1